MNAQYSDFELGICFTHQSFMLFAVVGGGMAGDFNRGAPGPVDYGRTDNFGASRTVDYTARNDYDRSATGPMRNGGGAVATTGYGTGYTDVGYDESHW